MYIHAYFYTQHALYLYCNTIIIIKLISTCSLLVTVNIIISVIKVVDYNFYTMIIIASTVKL